MILQLLKKNVANPVEEDLKKWRFWWISGNFKGHLMKITLPDVMSSFREESTMIPQELLVPFRVVWRNFLSSGGSHLPQSATALYRTEPSARPSPCSVVVVCWVLPDAATAYKNGFVRRQCTESGKFFTFKNDVLGSSRESRHLRPRTFQNLS